METFGIVCLLAVWAATMIGLIWWVVAALADQEYLIACFVIVILLTVAGMSALIYSGVSEDNRNPCVAWGSPRTTWMMVGKIMTPVTTTPCIQHQNETEH